MPTARRSTPTNSGTRGTVLSCPVLTRQHVSVMLRTFSQPPSRSTSSTSRCVNSPIRSQVLASVKKIWNAQEVHRVKNASSMEVSHTNTGLASSNWSQSSGISANGLSMHGGRCRRLLANVYTDRRVSRMFRPSLSRSFRLAVFG